MRPTGWPYKGWSVASTSDTNAWNAVSKLGLAACRRLAVCGAGPSLLAFRCWGAGVTRVGRTPGAQKVPGYAPPSASTFWPVM